MKKHKALRFIVAVLIVMTSTIVFPQEARAATPQIVSMTPNDGTVFSDKWDGVVTITYDRNIAFGNDSSCINLNKRFYNNGAWEDHVLDSFVAMNAAGDDRISIAGDTLTIDFYHVNPQAPVGNDFDGDINNTYNNDYKYVYWVEIDPGAIVSAGNGDPAEYFDHTDYSVSVQATPPQVVSRNPTQGATNVNGDNLVLTLNFDEDVHNYYSLTNAVKIYKYDAGAGAWVDAPQINCSTVISADYTKVKLYPSTDLEPDTLYGVMVSGIDNTIGPTDVLLRDGYWAAYGGIDYPSFYVPDFRFGDVWYFETAASFGPVTLDSKTPAAGATEVSVDSDLTMVFSEIVKANDDGGDYYVNIHNYNTGAVVTSIDADTILPAGAGKMTVTIEDNLFSLNKNKTYYVTVDQNAFVTTAGIEPFAGISNDSWYFSTTTTHRVRFFDHDDSQIGGDQTVDFGGDAVPPADPVRDGYVFKGWDGAYTNVTEDLDLNAVYAELFTLDYTAGANGSIQGTAQQTVESGGDGAQVTADPDDYYHFVQWSDGVATAARQDTNVSGDIDVTAEFAIDQYTLTYTAGAGGSIQGDTSQTVDYNGSGTQVTATPDTGYRFVQWSDGEKAAARTDTGITEDTTLQAQFEIIQYTLTYSAGDHGSIQGDTAQTVDYDGSGTLVTAVPDAHYHFVQWSDGVSTANRQDTNVADHISVTARFAINTYTVTFIDYNGSVLKKQQVKHGEDAPPPGDPYRTGYVFTGWDKGYKQITSDLFVRAQYTAVSCMVIFEDYDGTLIASQYVPRGSGAAPPADPARAGYVFAGWSVNFSSVMSDLIITAQYTQKTYTVTFTGYDGTVLKTESVPYGQGATAPDVGEREGYTFIGWDVSFDTVTSDMTVNAVYEPAEETSAEPTPVPQQTPKPIEVSGTRKGDDGTVVITVDTGGAAVESASVTGGEVIVNGDGTLIITLDATTAPSEVEIILTLSDGTTATQTITIPEEQNAEAPAAQTAQGESRSFPWLWLVFIIVSIICITLLTVYLRRKKE